MMKDCHLIRILNRFGEEIIVNALNPNVLYVEYERYV